MSLIDILAALPQFKSPSEAQGFVKELNNRGWLLSLTRIPKDEEWLPEAPEAHIGAINEDSPALSEQREKIAKMVRGQMGVPHRERLADAIEAKKF